MSTRFQRTIFTTVSTLFAIAASISCGGQPDGAAQIQATVERAIPLGATQLHVIAVLDSLHVEHSAYDATGHQILAIARNISQTASTKTSLQITFQFDSTEKLTSLAFKPGYTGP